MPIARLRRTATATYVPLLEDWAKFDAERKAGGTTTHVPEFATQENHAKEASRRAHVVTTDVSTSMFHKRTTKKRSPGEQELH